MSRHSNARRRWKKQTAAALAGILVAVLATACTNQSGPEGAAEPVFRVNQVGYLLGHTKTAYLLSPTGFDDATAQIVDTDGAIVWSAPVGPATGQWNERYPEVHRIDLSTFNQTGMFHLRLAEDHDVVSPPYRIATRKGLFDPLLSKNMTFFQTQRDGRNVGAGRSPSHLADIQATVYETPHYNDDGTELLAPLVAAGGPVDVEGGWFDAGDFLKFTHTTSYATADLLLAQRLHPDRADIAAEAQHGLTWLDKMWDGDTGVLSAQVGIGAGNTQWSSDHDVWRLPEADDTLNVQPGQPQFSIKHRPVFRVNTPGQQISPNLAGRVAAAFALAAQTTTETEQATTWLNKAAAVFAAADTAPSTLTTAFPPSFYPEDSWQDDLELGATELTIAAQSLQDPRAAQWKQQAEHWANAYVNSDARGTLGVADVSAIAHTDLISLGTGLRDELVTDLLRQLESGVANATEDPFGAGASYVDFDAVPHTLGLATTAALYETTTGDTTFATFATQQLDWVLGANPWGTSFMIGAGTVYPKCPEHQFANLTGTTLIGAVVNGPNAANKLDELNHFDTMIPCSSNPGEPWEHFDGRGARFLDDVGAWQTVEPAIDFTSTALLAFSVSARNEE